MGPATVSEESGLDVGPHPHVGLQTVTWLLDGQALHRDSLGSEQVIAPGQLNLMTAGDGVVHSEEATGHYRGQLEGIQLWVAQPEVTRHAAAGFEHHTDLPRVDLSGVTATVLTGEFGEFISPARHDTPLAGIDIDCHGGVSDLPLHPDWEYAAVVLRGALQVEGHVLTPGHLGYLGDGRDELRLDAEPGTRALLLGGVPFGEEIVMWWNFVARSRDELTAAYNAWRNGNDRFGAVTSPLDRIPAPEPYWK